MRGRGVCMAGGMYGGGGDMCGRVCVCVVGSMHGRGNVWQEAYVVGGHAWQGVCITGGVHGGGTCMAGEMTTAVGNMHPTGMHSCSFIVLIQKAGALCFSFNTVSTNLSRVTIEDIQIFSPRNYLFLY